MARGIVAEPARAARSEMVSACVEIRKNLVALEQCLASAELLELARKASQLAALYVRLEQDACGDRHVDDACLRTTGRVFCDVAIKLGEAHELVEVLKGSAVARHHMSEKLVRLGELTGQAFLLVDLPLDDA